MASAISDGRRATKERRGQDAALQGPLQKAKMDYDHTSSAAKRNQAVGKAPLAVSEHPVVPVAVRALLGPSWIVEGEDPHRYEELLAQLGAVVEPKDIIVWILLKDVVALTWLIQRNRRLSESFVRTGRRKGMEHLLQLSLPVEEDKFPDEGESQASEIARGWFNGDKEALQIVDAMLAKAGLTMNDVTAQSVNSAASDLGRLDRQNESYERRRNELLQQIERRQAGLADRALRASEEIVEAEFKEISGGNIGEHATTSRKAGA